MVLTHAELKSSGADVQKIIFHRKNPVSVKVKQGSFLYKSHWVFHKLAPKSPSVGVAFT